MSELRAARIRVPCSTSNLGSGYDTIGLALERFLEVSFEPDSSGVLTLERTGTLERLHGDGTPDLVETVFRHKLASVGIEPSGVMRQGSEIPVGRGLGSSAAATLAGYDLARAVLGEAPDPEGAFTDATRREGHPDNVAPTLHGGLQAVAKTADGPVLLALPLSPEVGFAYAAPAAGVSTADARSILPRQVQHKVAVASLGHVVALVRGLADGDPDLIRIGVTDDLHVPHRLSLIPGVMSAMSAGMDAGAWAVTLSGAGSGLIAMCPLDKTDAVAEAMHEMFDAGTDDPECVGFSVTPCATGLQRLSD